MAIIAGVDGCAAGWIVVQRDTESGRSSWCLASAGLASGVRRLSSVFIPIGLLDAALPGGRACDMAARKLLGPKRGSSVFPPPVRAALDCRTYPEALQAN